ncbi:MAG TPA: tricarballylate utilization 4Fe-4S protein TcuB [Candidatus Binatia bacterium]
MPSPDHLKEAERVMTLCNACRYCEGYCAVFPAMERRSSFTKPDLVHLANLCFECRACYYACPYAPPHEFGVNVPKTLAELRADSYRDYAWPPALGQLFVRNRLAAGLVTAGSVAAVCLLVLYLRGTSTVFATHVGAGAFYAVVPFEAMVLTAAALFLYAVFALGVGLTLYLRERPGVSKEPAGPAAFMQAAREALALVYLRGGGEGCNYPGAEFSHLRRRYHHLVFYGFLLDLASTSVAALYHHLLDWPAPYPFWSVPVLLGTVGGVMLLLGTAGLLYLKSRSDHEPADPQMLDMDVALLVLLLLTSLTGLLLLAFRETAAMGTLLAVHLGTVAGLFLTLPYGKFAHALYRYAALVLNAAEKREEASKGSIQPPTW